MTAAPDQRGLRSPTVRGAVLLAAHAALVTWIFYSQSRAWPHVGAWIYTLLYLACPGLFFHGFRLLFRWRTGRLPARRWLLRVFTIPAGLLLAAALSAWASQLALARFTRAYEPFVARIGANLPNPCGDVAGYHALPSVVAYNRETGRERPAAKLHHDPKRFVTAWGGGSVDIDGSTIYYDSASRQWHIVHNDNVEASEGYGRLTAGLAECPLRAAEP
jgi:hypothetical protein